MLCPTYNLRLVSCVDINHHLFGAVVMTLIKLIQLGGPVEVRPPTPWHWLATSLCFSYLIDDKGPAAVKLGTGFG
jgi:hypothetical protein